MTDTSRCSAEDTIAAMQALVTDDRLVHYFHFELTERKGVLLSDAAGIPGLDRLVALAPKVNAAPATAPIPAGWIALMLDSVECSPDRIEIRFRLPAEGLAGSATIGRSAAGIWSTSRIELNER